jgi:hypothetical protein
MATLRARMSHHRSPRWGLGALVGSGLLLAGCGLEVGSPNPTAAAAAYATSVAAVAATNETLRAPATPTGGAPAVPGTASPAVTAARAAGPGPPAPATPIPPPATAAPVALADLRRRAADAEATLRSGTFEAITDYGAGARAQATLRFDLGDAQRPPRLHLTTTYRGMVGSQAIEQITIGRQAWRRRDGGPWEAMPAPAAVFDDVLTYLPHLAIADEVRARPGVAGRPELAWRDPIREADVTLAVDGATGTPLALSQAAGSGPVQTITYRAWNAPVAIEPPAA